MKNTTPTPIFPIGTAFIATFHGDTKYEITDNRKVIRRGEEIFRYGFNIYGKMNDGSWRRVNTNASWLEEEIIEAIESGRWIEQ